MISIIICSREKTISKSLEDNIYSTIGCEYELIVINNSENKYSIFEAYNIGILRSKGKTLCFMHEDISIITKNWGKTVANIFDEDKNIGLIGVAGSKSKTKMPSAWWNCPDEDLCLNIIQHFSNKKKEHWQKGFKQNTEQEVVAIDGVFMVARKVDTISFSKELKGFHYYDLNLSFEYLKNNYKIVVTKRILLEHFSIGVLNESWYRLSLQFHQLYKELLPLNLLSQTNGKVQEFKNGCKFVTNLLKLKIKREAIFIWLKLIYIKPLSKFHFYFFKLLFR